MTPGALRDDPIGQALAARSAAADESAEADRRKFALLGLMRDAQGRQFVWEELLDGGALFRDCRVYTDAGCIDIGSSQIAYAEGARARVTWTRLWDECASAVGLMVSEAAARSEAKKAHQ